MSLRALEWAIYEVHPCQADDLVPGQCAICWAPAGTPEHHVDPISKMILILLADQADHYGRGAALSKITQASLIGVSESTIYSRTRRLIKLGLLAPGDPTRVAHLPANSRPRVWDLPRLDPGVRHTHPRRRRRPARDQSPAGVQQGCAGGAAGVRRSAPKPLVPGAPQSPAAAGGAAAGRRPQTDAQRRSRKDDIRRMREAVARGDQTS